MHLNSTGMYFETQFMHSEINGVCTPLQRAISCACDGGLAKEYHG
jgi:hypothetical protein